MTLPTFGEALDRLAEAEPRALAVQDGDAAIDRAELRARSTRLARLLIDAGVRVGDVVVVRGGNSVATVVAVVAVWRAGGTPLPLGPRVPPDQQRRLAALAGARLVLGGDDPLPGATLLPLDPSGEPGGEPVPPLAAASWKAMPTSGSTGEPKLVLATAPARMDPDRRAAPFLPRRARQLVAGPITHSAPFTYAMRGLLGGHALVLLPRFDPAAVLAAIERERITWALLVPTMLHRILRLPPAVLAAADLSSLEQVVHIGAPIAPAVKRRWIELLGPERITEVYAGTESNGLTVIRGDEWLRRPGSVGRAAVGTEIRVVDAGGIPVPPGVVGRVQLRRTAGPAYRYLGATTPAPGAWDTLGDDGHLDADGYLFLAGRAADRITRGAIGLYPAGIEAVLEQHPAVRSAVVRGLRDPVLGDRDLGDRDLGDRDLGDRIRAVVDVADRDVGAEELLAWAGDRLGPALRLDDLEVVHEPLRDDAGKVLPGGGSSADDGVGPPRAPSSFVNGVFALGVTPRDGLAHWGGAAGRTMDP